MPKPDLVSYYAARAAEYERVYQKPERQADLARLEGLVSEHFAGRRVLEVACGTGYWTAVLARRATSVVASDIGAEVLAIARAKPMPAGARVEFRSADAFDLAAIPGDFDAAFAGFWWSHVPRGELSRFLDGLHDRLGPGTRVMLLDNRYVEGSSTPITRSDAGNTYQRRVLESGAEYQVLKNFPMPSELRKSLGAAGARSVELIELPHYWCVTYEVNGRPAAAPPPEL